MKGILSEVFPAPQFESFKHDAILVKIQGEFFFGGEGVGLDQRTMWNTATERKADL